MVIPGCETAPQDEASTQPSPLGHFKTVEVVTEQATVRADGKQIATVKRARRFGVIAQDPGRVKVQVCIGTRIHRGWIPRRSLRFLTDTDIDLSIEALKLSAALDAKIDIPAYKARLDALADRVAAAAAGGETPRGRILLANEQIFGREGFHTGDIGVNVLDIVLDKKQGSCIGLSVLYLCATRKLGLPLYLVSAPRHVFVRYDDGRVRFNIETTTGGTVHESDDFLVEHLGRRLSEQAGGVDQLTLANARVLGVLYQQRASYLTSMGRLADACKDLARAVEINPLDATCYASWASRLLVLDDTVGAIQLCSRALKLNPRLACAHFVMGRALRDQLQWKNACKHFASVIRQDPPRELAKGAYEAWARTLVRLGDFEKAHVKFAAVASYDPGGADYWYGLANLAKRIGEEGGTAGDFFAAEKAERRARLRHLRKLLEELRR